MPCPAGSHNLNSLHFTRRFRQVYKSSCSWSDQQTRTRTHKYERVGNFFVVATVLSDFAAHFSYLCSLCNKRNISLLTLMCFTSKSNVHRHMIRHNSLQGRLVLTFCNSVTVQFQIVSFITLYVCTRNSYFVPDVTTVIPRLTSDPANEFFG